MSVSKRANVSTEIFLIDLEPRDQRSLPPPPPFRRFQLFKCCVLFPPFSSASVPSRELDEETGMVDVKVSCVFSVKMWNADTSNKVKRILVKCNYCATPHFLPTFHVGRFLIDLFDPLRILWSTIYSQPASATLYLFAKYSFSCWVLTAGTRKENAWYTGVELCLLPSCVCWKGCLWLFRCVWLEACGLICQQITPTIDVRNYWNSCASQEREIHVLVDFFYLQ